MKPDHKLIATHPRHDLDWLLANHRSNRSSHGAVIIQLLVMLDRQSQHWSLSLIIIEHRGEIQPPNVPGVATKE
jgi:hypothetical protein